ncbi:hypothetical protein Hypma_015422 [Hypsizygus marmoreus]|uniref:Uncharacterized protein n=1 Tax=Hypsizygus marmoreus TaxID=39966 RepID=A0A369KCV5_HYPMA|nr:hypothetical protein Hypma_015422 [Hypsizygus marmoreus]
MSGLLRRPLCHACHRLHFSRAFASTSFLSLPPSAHEDPVAGLFQHVNKSSKQKSSRTNSGTRTKRTVDESSKAAAPRRNLLKESKLQDYLDLIASTSQEITLADIERCKPAGHAAPRTPEYEQQYNSLVETLVRSFSLHQLRQFLVLYHLDMPTRRTKWDIAANIIERQWNWPSLTTIKKEKKEWTEIATETFPLDVRQSFLILGKDGADLLALSSEFNVHVSFSVNPLSLKVEGLRGSMGNLRRYIEEFKLGIQEQMFKLPPGRTVESDSLQRISRLSGVFIENQGSDVIRLSYRNGDDRAAHFAKRLTMRAAFEVTQEVPLLVHFQPENTLSSSSPFPPATYSLYPFLSSRSAPRLSNTGNLFRIRRVGEWFKYSSDSVPKAKVLADGGAIADLSGTTVDLKNVLLNHFPEILRNDNRSNTVITASFGHYLVSSDASQRTSITPPLQGNWELSKILAWLESQKPNSLFVPSLPVPLLNLPPAQQRLIHRLVYQSFPMDGEESLFGGATSPTKILKFELGLEMPESKPPAQDYNSSGGEAVPDHEEEGSANSSKAPATPSNELGVALQPTCSVGSLRKLDLMMPDRPMDIRFTVLNSSLLLQDSWPEDLRSYFHELTNFLTFAAQGQQPETPLTFVYQGIKYGLQSSSTVRQNLEPLPSNDASVHTASESILDLESNQRSRECQVTCENIQSDDSWIAFLTQCNLLSSPSDPISLMGNDRDTSSNV